MSWMEKLYNTYHSIEKLSFNTNTLEPYYHKIEKSHIEIVIDNSGNFKRAKSLVYENLNGKNIKWMGVDTIIPITPKSLTGRTSGAAPYPLAEKIQYLDNAYESFGGRKKSYFDEYIKLLSGWCSSDFFHPKAQAVLSYVNKQNVIKDLIDSGVLFSFFESGKEILVTSWVKQKGNDKPPLFKVSGFSDQGGALVRWVVESTNEDNPTTWGDEGLKNSWINYQESVNAHRAQNDLCFITGRKDRYITNTHPKSILQTADATGAKLISKPTDKGYLTYQGRFCSSDEVLSVSFEVSQKAHNALRWLIKHQGIVTSSTSVVVFWAMSGKAIPSAIDEKIPETDWDILEDEVADGTESNQQESESSPDLTIDLGKKYAEKVKRHMQGYRQELASNDTVSIMAIDSATPGRMGVSYYRESMPEGYLDDIIAWHTDFAWVQLVTMKSEIPNKDKKIWLPSSPLVRNIARCAYGKNINDALMKNFIERLLSCIVDGNNLPEDILFSCVRSSCNPLSKRKDDKFSTMMSERSAWLDDVAITCALYKGFCYRTNNLNFKKEYLMSLDQDNKSRDYLYGRLLAVAEKIESVALEIAKESRLTNAERLFQKFSAMPSSTWLNIERSIQPYQQRLSAKYPGLNFAYKKLLDDIFYSFNEGEFILDKKLSGEFLLGYHCQRRWLNYHKLSKGQWVLKTSAIENELQIINE